MTSSPVPSSPSSPVVVGHRGFKSQYTENSLLGFGKCYESGATVIETDLWLASDDVIVISHDVNTKRVFVDSKGNETDYVILKTPYEPVLKHLQTKEGRYPLLSFVDLLKWFTKYVEEHGDNVEERKLKIQLDIKKFNPTKITKYIVQDLLSVKNDITWWFGRIQFGIWDLKFLKYLNQDEFFQREELRKIDEEGFTQFDIFHISLNWRDSINYINYNEYLDETTPKNRKVLKLTGVSLIYVSTWSTEFLTKFVPLLRIQHLKLYSWTVNNKFQYEYLARVGKLAKLVEYGIISDYPDVIVDIKHHSREGQENVSNGEYLSEEESQPLVLKDYESSQYFNEDGELNIELTYFQRMFHWIFTVVMSLNGSSRNIRTDAQKFGAKVDDSKIEQIKINPFTSKIFQTCQKYGVF